MWMLEPSLSPLGQSFLSICLAIVWTVGIRGERYQGQQSRVLYKANQFVGGFNHQLPYMFSSPAFPIRQRGLCSSPLMFAAIQARFPTTSLAILEGGQVA